MPIQQLPLMKGVGKDFRNADYIDYQPVNMLATPKAVRIDEHGDVRANCIDHMHVVALTNFHCCSFRAVSPQILHA